MGSKNPFDDEESTVAMSAEERAAALRTRPSAPARAPAERPATSSGRTAVTAKHPAAGGVVPSAKPSLPARTVAMAPLPARREEGARFNSGFDGKEPTRTEALLGSRPTTTGEIPALRVPTREQIQAVAKRFDGMTASGSVVKPPSRLQPLEPELTSTPGARDPLLSGVVLDQFAPEVNPRYVRGEAGQLFIWDYTHAMGCAVPRFRGSSEMTLEQMCAWFRTLSNDAGWVRISGPRAAEVAAAGSPVIALPANARNARIAVARPDACDDAGFPLLASACSKRPGNQLTLVEAFGERHGDFYFHE